MNVQWKRLSKGSIKQAKFFRHCDSQHSFGCSQWRPLANAYESINRSISLQPYCTVPIAQSFNFRPILSILPEISFDEESVTSNNPATPSARHTQGVNSTWHLKASAESTAESEVRIMTTLKQTVVGSDFQAAGPEDSTSLKPQITQWVQESLADAKVSARQQCVYEGP